MASKITFQELIDEFSDATGHTKVFSKKFIKDVFASIQEGLRKDENVNIKGLGIFKLQEVAEREILNPKTGKTNRIPAHNKIVFKPEKALRERVNRKYADLKPIPLRKEEKPAKTEKPPVKEKISQEKAVSPEEPPVFGDSGKKPAEEKTSAPPPPPSPPSGEKKKMPTFIIEEKKKKSAWRWILPLLLIILIFIVLYVIPTKFDSFEKISFWKNGNDIERTNEAAVAETTESTIYPDDIFKEAPKPRNIDKETTTDREDKSIAEESHRKKEVTDLKPLQDDEQTFIHIVKPGNTLWGLSASFYNRASLWPNIYRKNIETMHTPDLLVIGNELIVPELQGTACSLTKIDSARISQGYYLAYRAYKKYDSDKAEDYLKVAETFSTTR
ncbi:MAG: HU family DNA-binding protein [Fidelibacterota bacterium]